MCRHRNARKNGDDRHGKQRWLCRDCGHTFIDTERVGRVYRLSTEQHEHICRLIAAGMSVREIVRMTGHGNVTVMRRIPKPTVAKPPRILAGEFKCDNCGGDISGKREFHRRKRRTKHKFCSHDCFNDFYRSLRANDQCKRCGRTRRECGICAVFSSGYCQRCYSTLLQFGFDEEQAAVYDLTQSLKREMKNVEARTNQKHG